MRLLLVFILSALSVKAATPARPLEALSAISDLSTRRPQVYDITFGVRVAGKWDFKWVAGGTNQTPDGWFCITNANVPSGAYIRQNWDGDVRAAGVAGDGATDDLTLLQSAVNRAQTTGKRLLIPDITNAITAPLLITSRLEVYGPGVILESGGVLTNLIRISGNGVKISGITVRGTETTNTWDSSLGQRRIGIRFENATNCEVSGATITGKSTGIYVDGNSRDVRVSRNKIEGFLPAGSDTNGVSGVNNSAGVFFRDSHGSVIGNDITKVGQGVCSSNTDTNLPVLRVVGNHIYDVADNGVYLVLSENSTISGNIIENADQVGIKAHGSGTSISGNTIEGCYVGISPFPIHVNYTNGWLYSYSTQKWGTLTTQWISSAGITVVGNTIRGALRHGIDASDYSFGGMKFYSIGLTIAENQIFEWGSTDSDVGIKVNAETPKVTGNTLQQARGTASQFGIGIGLGDSAPTWKDVDVSGNTVVSTNAADIAVSVRNVVNAVVGRNIISAGSVYGIQVVGAGRVKIEHNELPAANIRFEIDETGTAVLLNNVRSNTQSLTNQIGFGATVITNFAESWLTDSALVVSNLITATASVDANYPWQARRTRDGVHGIRVRNDSEGTASVSALNLISGSSDTVSGSLEAYQTNHSSANFRDRVRLAANSDALGLILDSAAAGGAIDEYIAGTLIRRALTNLYQIRTAAEIQGNLELDGNFLMQGSASAATFFVTTNTPDGNISATAPSIALRYNPGTAQGELWFKLSGVNNTSGWTNMTIP